MNDFEVGHRKRKLLNEGVYVGSAPCLIDVIAPP